MLKFNEEADAVPSVESLLNTAIVTSAEGCESSTTVNVAIPPASVVIRPAAGVTVTPTVSFSAFVTETSAGKTPIATRL